MKHDFILYTVHTMSIVVQTFIGLDKIAAGKYEWPWFNLVFAVVAMVGMMYHGRNILK